LDKFLKNNHYSEEQISLIVKKYRLKLKN